MGNIPKDIMQGFDKELVGKKLREIGKDDIADKLNSISEKEIEKMISSNPDIVKKAIDIIREGKFK